MTFQQPLMIACDKHCSLHILHYTYIFQQPYKLYYEESKKRKPGREKCLFFLNFRPADDVYVMAT